MPEKSIQTTFAVRTLRVVAIVLSTLAATTSGAEEGTQQANPVAIRPGDDGSVALKSIGSAQAFNFEVLKSRAKALAREAYQAPPATLPAPIQNLTWDQMQAIHFRPDQTLWRTADTNFRIRFFHLGLYNRVPVKIYEVVHGQARQLAYDPALFNYGRSGVDGRKLPKDLGFAGFQLAFHNDWQRDVAAFLGASYFRAVSEAKQFGLSARGLAIDCGLPKPEEFPIFTEYWLERPAANVDQLAVYGLLDSPSVTGAYRFVIAPGEPLTMDVDAVIYPRGEAKSWGFAPLTSMYQCAENDRRMAIDFRPEIHDSDGLAIWTGAGERIWRPLNNPPVLRVNSFFDANPRGFGLLQRDRNFDHYQDDGVFYDRRPSLWVEPKASGTLWQKGAIKLVEIPTVDETFDNIVAFWEPADAPKKKDVLAFAYRLYWGIKIPSSNKLGITVASRTGIGGEIGQPRKHYSRRFVIDFVGEDLASLKDDTIVEPVITVSRGVIDVKSARVFKPIKGWRAVFDIQPTDDSVEPIDIRLFLRAGGRTLTETWLYQWTPPPPTERKF